jgi:hypothetical protein
MIPSRLYVRWQFWKEYIRKQLRESSWLSFFLKPRNVQTHKRFVGNNSTHELPTTRAKRKFSSARFTVCVSSSSLTLRSRRRENSGNLSNDIETCTSRQYKLIRTHTHTHTATYQGGFVIRNHVFVFSFSLLFFWALYYGSHSTAWFSISVLFYDFFFFLPFLSS